MKRKTAVAALPAPQPATQLGQIALQGCLVAKDAAFNLRDFISTGSNMAYLTLRDCEKELDRMERKIDNDITTAITGVDEEEARELLACLKFIIDLERIGDLTWSITLRLHKLQPKLSKEDSRDLLAMAEVLEKMLQTVYDGYLKRELKASAWVLHADGKIDDLCHEIFHRHLEILDRKPRDYSVTLLFIAQAFERAGDHAKNLGEELFHLVEGRTMRHDPKRLRSSE
jgi:phosphate transport system protein